LGEAAFVARQFSGWQQIRFAIKQAGILNVRINKEISFSCAVSGKQDPIVD
jgi:hypothetical protein